MAGEIIIDGTQLSWQDFADRLVALNTAPQEHAVFGDVRPPKGCGTEARRLLRALDLDDRIALIAEEPADRSRLLASFGGMRGRISAALTALRPPIAPQEWHIHD